MEAPYEIWLWLAKRFLRRCLKGVDDGRKKDRLQTTDYRWWRPTYPVSSPVSLRLRWGKKEKKLLRWVTEWFTLLYEPGHEKMCLMSYANNKGADQPAHPRSLISPFVVHCLDSIISLDSIAEISRLQLASVAAQAGLCLAWSETIEDTFCRGVSYIY